MESSQHEPGWMTQLEVIHTERRICRVRLALLASFLLASMASCLQAHQPLAAIVIVLGAVLLGLCNSLWMLRLLRQRPPGPGHWYASNSADVTAISAILIGAALAQSLPSALFGAAQLAYCVAIVGAAGRFHSRSTFYAAGLAAVQFGALITWAELGRVWDGSSAGASMVGSWAMAIGPLFLLLVGAASVQLIQRSRKSFNAFQSAERIHTRIINQISDGFLVCNAQGRIVDVNAAACEVLQIPRSVLVELEASSALPKGLAQVLRDRWKEILSTGFALAYGIRLENDNGEPTLLDLAAQRVNFQGEEVVHIVLHDVTAAHRLREHRGHFGRLRALSALTGSVANEFNNIFASVEASAYVLRDAIPAQAPEHTEIEIIRDATSRATGLVRELVDLTDVRPPVVEPLDLRALVEKSLALHRAPNSSQVSLQLDIPSEIRRVLGEEGQLVRALGNLIGWAHGAMLDGGTLRIVARNISLEHRTEELFAGDYVELQVSDTGIGMPAETVCSAFDPFFASGERPWRGFALANVRAAICRHRGSVQLSSTLGRGSAFTLRLPATDRPSLPQALPVDKAPAQDRKVRLLVVDDEPTNRKSLARLLSRLGYEVLLAEDGPSALELFEHESIPIDLVLLDLLMPGLSGQEVLTAMRTRMPEIKVLVLTGYADQTQVDDALSSGAVGVAQKPFEVDDLLREIRRWTSCESHDSSRAISTASDSDPLPLSHSPC